MAVCVVLPLGPACVDLTGIRAGDRNQFTMSLTQGGSPLDLTGLTVTAQARLRATDLDGEIDAVITVTDATNGEITVRWPGEDVRTAMAGKATYKGVWDLQVESPPDDPVTLIEGKFLANMDVTR